MDLERLIVKLTADVAQYNRAMDAAEARIARFARSVPLLGAMIDIPFLAAAGAVTAVGAAMGFAAVESIRLAASFEKANIALEVMTGSATVAKGLMAEIIKMGIETPFKSTELLGAAQILKGYNVQNEDLIDTLRVLGDVAQGDADKLNRIARAYGQVKSAGRLMGQEMLQFINAGAISNEDLARVMGVHPSRVKTMIEEAKVSFGTVVKAFNDITGPGGRFFQMNQRINQTVAGQWSALVETIQLNLTRIGESFFRAFDVQGGLANLTKMLTGSTAEGTFDQFFGKAKAVFDDVVRAVRFVVFWVEKAVEAVRNFAKEDSFLLNVLKNLAVAILAVAAAMAVVTVATTAWAFATNPLVMALAALTASLTLLAQIGMFENLGQGFSKMAKTAEAEFTELGGLITEAFTNQDWQAMGELIGVGLKMGVMTAWHGLMAEMRVVFIDLMKWQVRTAGTIGFMLADLQVRVLDELNPTIDRQEVEDRANKRKALFLDKFVTPVEKVADVFANTARTDQAKRLEQSLAPYRDDMDRIRKQMGERALVRGADQVAEEERRWRAEHPILAAQQDAGNKIVNEAFRRIVAHRAGAIELFGAEETWSDLQKAGFEGWRQAQLDRALEDVKAAKVQVAEQMRMQGVKDTGIRVPFQFRPETIQYVARLTRELERGQWAGEATDKLDMFQRNMSTIAEAFSGPQMTPDRLQVIGGWMAQMAGGNPLGALGGFMLNAGDMRPLIGDKERDFATFQEFANLRRAIGQREPQLAGALFAGSTEAQDAVNKAQLRQVSVQEQVRNLLEEAKYIQEQQRDYMKQVVDELKKINQENAGDFGGGGDF